jgi:PAS domain S-box-containing protein
MCPFRSNPHFRHELKQLKKPSSRSDPTPQKRDRSPIKAPQPEALLAAIVASSEDAIASKTLEGIVTSWNVAAERVFGFTAQEMIGQSILKIIPPELHEDEQRILSELRAGRRVKRYETVRLRKDGTRIDISLTVSPVRDSSGHIVGAAKVAHDITALRVLTAERERLLEAERFARSQTEKMSRLKDEFLATLSHELRTPLNAIQGWAVLLQHPGSTPQDVARGLEAIARNVRIQTQLVSDLLDMSRIVSGQVALEVRPTSLQELLRHAIDTIKTSADSKSIRIQTLFDSRIGPVRGDPTRLQQVLWNLLTNAVKFTPKGGHIKVILERVDSHVEVAIEDSGVGIEPDFLPYVFDRFRQAEAGISRRYGGLGLGLSIVKSLVELHGGFVKAKSPGKDKGATFIIALPVFHLKAGDDRPARSDPVDEIGLPHLGGANILLVDDDLDGCELVSTILGREGAQVHCVASGREALQLLARRNFHLILSDIGMPDMNGYEFIREFRKVEQERSTWTPAIAITAYAGAEDRKRALLSGYQMHLAKPFEAPELIAAVGSLQHAARR